MILPHFLLHPSTTPDLLVLDFITLSIET
uniref:Uncharacterized protein n=1 Tax=Amphimedon queenslandica TaxID=400682 RepID=A0A1X7UZ69_AMPQE